MIEELDVLEAMVFKIQMLDLLVFTATIIFGLIWLLRFKCKRRFDNYLKERRRIREERELEEIRRIRRAEMAEERRQKEIEDNRAASEDIEMSSTQLNETNDNLLTEVNQEL